MNTPDQVSEFYNVASDVLNEHGEMKGDGIYFTLPFVLDGAERSISIDSYATGMTEQGADFSRMGTPETVHEASHRRLLGVRLGWLSLMERAPDGYAMQDGLSYTAFRPSTDAQGFARSYVDRQAPGFGPDNPVIYDFRADTLIAEPLQHPVLSVIYRRLVTLQQPE